MSRKTHTKKEEVILICFGGEGGWGEWAQPPKVNNTDQTYPLEEMNREQNKETIKETSRKYTI